MSVRLNLIDQFLNQRSHNLQSFDYGLQRLAVSVLLRRIARVARVPNYSSRRDYAMCTDPYTVETFRLTHFLIFRQALG